MRTVLAIKPLGPSRLAQLPVLASDFLSLSVGPALGLPMPSTILGLLGSAVGVRLSKDQVARDPLLGLTVIIQELESRGFNLVQGCLAAGPFIRVENGSKTGRILVPVYSKTGTLLVDAEKLAEIAQRRRLIDNYVIARVAQMSQVGIHLSDRDDTYRPELRVVRLGYTYRRTLTYIAHKGSDRGLRHEFLYVIHGPPQLQIPKLVRLGGEGRFAALSIEEPGPELEGLVRVLTTLDKVESRGVYMILTPCPLLPSNETIYYEDSVEPALRVLGVPTQAGLRYYITRLGLGYSEVAKARRPQLPALPSGTLVQLNGPVKLSPLAETLLRAGYCQVLRVTDGE